MSKFIQSCKNNDVKKVKSFVTKLYNDLRKAFLEACKTGNVEIITLVLSQIDWRYQLDERDDDILNEGINLVTLHGHQEALEYLVAQKYYDDVYKTTISGLYGACFRNDKKMIKYLIDHGDVNFEEGLVGATEGENEELAKEMRELLEKHIREQL